MQQISATSSPAHDPAKTDWDFVEVQIDPLLSPPYLLLLMGKPSGSSRIHDSADCYKAVFSSATYDEAKTWLLEDEYEYEPVSRQLASLKS